MTEGLVVLATVVVLATAFGLYRAARDGRFRGTHGLRRSGSGPAGDAAAADEAAGARAGRPSSTGRVRYLLGAAGVEQEWGRRATLVQFSSAFCAPCRATRRVLDDVARLVPGVVHVEVDAEAHLDLVRALGITRTPTTLVVDRHGRETSRATGAPTRDQVLAALDRPALE